MSKKNSVKTRETAQLKQETHRSELQQQPTSGVDEKTTIGGVEKQEKQKNQIESFFGSSELERKTALVKFRISTGKNWNFEPTEFWRKEKNIF